mmetsp:Transcript_2835/g.4960  ORF Transcript_2835/g.4960 Transcript_2835/m.4960 type:complete len:247 (+) Transcript_2835:39-779(+)
MASFRVLVTSDFMCPFCYIGKRHLEKALSELQADTSFPLLQNAAKDVIIEFRPFQLAPALSSPIPVYQYINKVYGSSYASAEEFQLKSNVTPMLDKLGLKMHVDRYMVNTFLAHRVTCTVQAKYGHNVANEFVDKVLESTFGKGEDISRADVLAQCLVNACASLNTLTENHVDVGPKNETEALDLVVAQSEEYDSMTRELLTDARKQRIRGVPYFQISSISGPNQVVQFSGAQPVEIMKDAFRSVA